MTALSRHHRTVRYAVSVCITILFFLLMVFPGSGRGQPITEGFNGFQTGTRPAGWIFYGCNNDWDVYTSVGDYGLASPSIKLDTNSYYIQTAPLVRPGELTFWVKGKVTDTSSALLVEEYYAGAGWSEVTNVMSLPTVSGTNLGPFELAFLTTAARFTFDTGPGAIAFDDVYFSLAPPTPTPAPSAQVTTTPTPTATPPPLTNFYNPSFELEPPLTGWTAVESAAGKVERSTEYAYDGTYSCKFKAPTSKYDGRGIKTEDTVLVPIIPGDGYIISGWFYVHFTKGDIGNTQFRFNIVWLNAAGATVYTNSDEGWSLHAFDNWEEKQYTVTAPVTVPPATQVRIYIAAKEDVDNENEVFIDLFTIAHAPEITVTAPTQGDAWYINTINNITWDSYSITGNIDIHYSTDGGPWIPVDINIANTGTYPWNVPNDPSDQARVRVRDTIFQWISGESGQFTIAGRDTINVISPHGGETLYQAASYDIEWTPGPDVGPGNVDIHYSTDNGSSWKLIAGGVAIGSSPYPWTIPDENSSECLVRVRQPSSGIAGQSPAVFTIALPTFTVTSPSGGETWYLGDSETITWTSTSGISGNININYSTNGVSGPWAEIASNQPNTGSFSPWAIPNDSSSACRVRVSEIGGHSEPGISAADFTIVGAPIPQPYLKLGWKVHGNLSEYGCSLYSIEAIDTDDIWVGSACSKIFYYDGTSWINRVQIGTNTKAIGATGTDDVWFGQAYGSAYNFNGLGFWDQALPRGKDVKAVSAVDQDNIWMAADKYVFHTSGLFTGWDEYETEPSGTIADMIFLRPYQGWILKGATETTNTRVLYTDDGSTWTVQSSFGKWGIGALTGCIDQNGIPKLWVVGDCGVIFHSSDGVNWSRQTTIGVINWECAEALDQNNVWISGGGDIYHYNGYKWIFETDDAPTLEKLSAVDNTHVYGIDTTSMKIWWTFALPTSTPTPIGYKTPSPTPIPTATPWGYKTPTPTPVSVICNNSFEESPDLTCWVKYGTASSIKKSGEEHYDGSYSCFFKEPTSSFTGRGIYSYPIPVIGGEPYIFSGWYFVKFDDGAITNTDLKFEAWWYEGDDLIRTDSFASWNLSAFDAWEEKVFTASAPATADNLRIYISCKETVNNNNSVFIDLFNLVRPPAFSVTAPAAGAAWYVGQSYDITWESVSISGNVDLHYSTDNGSSWTAIAGNIANTDTYTWPVVPDTPSSQCLVRVRQTGGTGVSAKSGQFRIAARNTINVLSPLGGETWYQTGVYNIQWSAGPAVGGANVKLEYSANNGSSWTDIATGIGVGSSPYPWTVPIINSNKCLVRVSQTSSGISGQSPAVFTITAPTFIVTSPRSGETWYYGDTNEITWTATIGVAGNVNLDYSSVGAGGPWTQIAVNQPNSGEYSWTIPNVNSGTARIRISEVGGISQAGLSGAFTLRGTSPPQAYRPLIWSVLSTIYTDCSLYTIEAFDSSHIWVGGSCGVIFFWDGNNWLIQDELSNIKDFKALAADDVWAGGLGGAIYHFDGTSWQREWSSPKDIKSIDACDRDHVLASSYENQAMYMSNYSYEANWSNYRFGSTTVRNVVYLKPDLAYVCVGASGSIIYQTSDPSDLESWYAMGSAGFGMNSNPFTGCLDQNYKPRLWVAGDCGYIKHYDGSAWSIQTRVVEGVGWPNFECIAALDENNVWASGGGKVYRYNGSKWIVEEDKITTFYCISPVNSGLAYAVGSTGSQKIYVGRALPTPTPWHPTTPTPYGYETPSPTPVPVDGPVKGRVYDRVTGVGIGNVYVRALPLEAGLRPGGGFANSSGYYTVPGLLAGTYNVYCDSNQGWGIRVYRSQWYDQKDGQSQASSVSSNTSGIDFPLYKAGVYPSPTTTPTPDFEPIMVAGGDYDGDGASDIAIFRGSLYGLWAVRGVTRTYFGNDGDIPVSGDYDGDGCADIALFRGTTGLWAIRGMTRNYFGGLGDLPVPGDYDGDGLCDKGIFRPTAGLWAVMGLGRVYFGGAGDTPVSADYDGDGFVDISVFRSTTRMWAVKDVTRTYFGSGDDTVIPGDYDGSGTAAPAIYRPSYGLWAVRGITRVYFGGVGRQPVPADYTGDLRDDMGLFRPAGGLWAVRGVTRVYYGSSGDLPATR